MLKFCKVCLYWVPAVVTLKIADSIYFTGELEFRDETFLYTGKGNIVTKLPSS
jgi:hypothetical protein